MPRRPLTQRTVPRRRQRTEGVVEVGRGRNSNCRRLSRADTRGKYGVKRDHFQRNRKRERTEAGRQPRVPCFSWRKKNTLHKEQKDAKVQKPDLELTSPSIIGSGDETAQHALVLAWERREMPAATPPRPMSARQDTCGSRRPKPLQQRFSPVGKSVRQS